MSEFTDKLGEIHSDTPKKSCIPKTDGKYILPDRRILVREGSVFTLVGHRDKKRMRQLEKYPAQQLKTLLKFPGFGNYTEQQLKDVPDNELARMLNPRPHVTFHVSWLYTSGCTEAKQLRKLVKQAELL